MILGINLLWIHAGFLCFIFSLTCLVILNYGSWSIAWGIKHGISFLLPNIWGNVVLKLGDAWIGGKPIWPILELLLKPNIPLTWLYVVNLATFKALGYKQSI